MDSKIPSSIELTDKRGAEGATAPRITLDHMKSQIVATYYIDGETLSVHAGHTDHTGKQRPFPPSLAKLTVAMMVLKSGFVVIGKSAPMSPENFDAAKGRVFAYEDCIRQLWPMFAFSHLQIAHEICG